MIEFSQGRHTEGLRHAPTEDSLGGTNARGLYDLQTLVGRVYRCNKSPLSILGKSQLAQTEHNSALFNELELLKLAAAERRSKARLELRQHEASHQVEVVKPQVQRDA